MNGTDDTTSGNLPATPSDDVVVEVDGKRFDVRVFREPTVGDADARPRRPRSRGTLLGKPGPVVAPIPGNVMQVHVADGDVVEAGQILCVIEAMKMENEITAPAGGTVAALSISEGDLVAGGQQLMLVEAVTH